MPRGDGTGPAGMGPMTGRAAGYCAGYAVPGYLNPMPGRGMGFGRGRGWFGRGRGGGWRNMYFSGGYPGWQPPVPAWGMYPSPAPTVTAEQELNALKSQVKYMEDDLKATRERIAELEKGPTEDK